MQNSGPRLSGLSLGCAVPEGGGRRQGHGGPTALRSAGAALEQQSGQSSGWRSYPTVTRRL
eukprot:6684501-Pyramimonas_sp.AAC.1